MIAEHAFGLMLAVARKICTGNQRYREERRFDSTGLSGVELYGKTLGVIGAGRIGTEVVHQGGALRIGHGSFDRLAVDGGVQVRDLKHAC